MAAEVPGFGPAPAWRPFEEEARRWLRGKPAQKAGAVLALADLGGEEPRRLVTSELARETDPDLRSLLGSCLVALGDREHLDACRADFQARLAVRLDEAEVSGERIREYPGWGLHDMAENLLRGGDARLLERAVELAAKEETNPFALAVAAAVPALPLWEIFDVLWDSGAVQFLSDSQHEERSAVTRLRRWWSENGPKLRYDPASRTFVLP